MDKEIEYHPLEPFLPENTRLLILGSFPPKQERWGMNFYYPNFQNDMWRIFGLIFFNDKDYFIVPKLKRFDPEKIKLFLSQKGIGIGDTARAVIRHKNNASDRDLEVVEATDLLAILNQRPTCKALVTTGQKATDTLMSTFSLKEPKVGNFSDFYVEERLMQLFRMPSSSRAYPKSIEAKADIYKQMFDYLEMLS